MPLIVKCPPAKTKITDALAIVRRLALAIRHDFRMLDEIASVTSEPIRGTKLRRVTVVSPLFHHLGFMEQQTYIWRIATRVLDSDEVIFLSMIVTVDPVDTIEEPTKLKAPARQTSR